MFVRHRRILGAFIGGGLRLGPARLSARLFRHLLAQCLYLSALLSDQPLQCLNPLVHRAGQWCLLCIRTSTEQRYGRTGQLQNWPILAKYSHGLAPCSQGIALLFLLGLILYCHIQIVYKLHIQIETVRKPL
ncbi:hypothetical protein J2X19_002053 [Rhodoferax ferrireducens]|uniref:Uncharacterized protein n=1 Tax=Rhodoferax ferrireducens TaxID=192843 RepID=A0ABU2C7W4_9BURK|nr:hypothetical protein [Rhodoferax ferrireducens]MDR7377374.1 hypothetical protein [Rhodoferax ferrireducens]